MTILKRFYCLLKYIIPAFSLFLYQIVHLTLYEYSKCQALGEKTLANFSNMANFSDTDISFKNIQR